MTNDKALEAALLPCPFCGGVALAHPKPDRGYPRVMCHSHGCLGRQSASTIEEAIAAWNRRAPLSALPGEAEVAQLIAELREQAALSSDPTNEMLTDAADALQAMQARAEAAERERDEAIAKGERQWAGWVKEEVARKAAEASVKELEEALSPSAETKAAYMGEFSFKEEIFDGETDTYITVERTVPWTTIKEIMAAIRARTALTGGSNG